MAKTANDQWEDVSPNSDWEDVTSAPKRQFNTIAEAQAAMQQARINQRNAESDASGIMPYITQPPKMMPDATNFNNAVNAIVPSLLGGGMVGNTILKGGAALAPSIGRQIVAGMAGGAVGGAIAPADNMQQRGVNAGTGALLGAAGSAVTSGIGAGAKFVGDTWRKGANLIKLNKSLPNANKLQDAIDQLNISKSSAKSAQDALDINTKANTGKVSEVLAQDKNIFKKSLDEVVTAFNKNKEDFKKVISDKSGEFAKNIKQPTVTFFRNASKTYGETRDAIFAALDDPIQAGSLLKKNATPVSRTEFLDEANSVLKEFADQPDIVNSKSYSGLVDLVKKYGAEGADTGIVDASGKAIKQALPESLDFKQLIGDLKDYNKTFSTGFESGSKALSPDELVAARFNYNMGNIIKERVPKFAELQKSYKPVIDNKKLAYTIFKPGNEVSSTSAQALFKRIANGKASQQDKDLLKFIQTGTKVGDTNVPGIGNFTKELDDIATQIAKSGKQFDLSKRALTAKNELDIQTLKEVSKTLVDKNRTNQLSTLKQVEQLDNRLSRLTDLLRRRKDIDAIKTGLAVKAATAIGVGGGGYIYGKLNK